MNRSRGINPFKQRTREPTDEELSNEQIREERVQRKKDKANYKLRTKVIKFIIDGVVILLSFYLVYLACENVSLRRELESQDSEPEIEIDEQPAWEPSEPTVEIIDNRILNQTEYVNYASDINGARIIQDETSESYYHYRNYFFDTNAHFHILRNANAPGQCWAFSGSSGHITIQLAAAVSPFEFTMSHILTVNNENAPRGFSVYNFETNQFLGKYQYVIGAKEQRFRCEELACDEKMDKIQLKIHSNHGNKEETCIYQFKVHGLQ